MKDLEHSSKTIPVVVYAILVGIVCLVLGFVFNPVWESNATRINFHAVLAFIIIISAAAAVERAREHPTVEQLIFISALLYLAIVHLGTSIGYLLQFLSPETTTVEIRAAMTIIEAGVFAVMMLSSAKSKERENNSLSGPRMYFTAVFFVFGPLVLHGVSYLFLLQSTLPFIHQLVGVFTGIIGIAALALATLRFSAQQEELTDKVAIRFARGSLIFLFSFIPLFVEFLFPAGPFRMLSLMLQICTFIFFNRALVYAVLPKESVPFQSARRFMSVLPSFLSFPFVTTLFAEMFAPLIAIENPSLDILLHLEAGLLSGVFLFLLYQYSRRKIERGYYPFLFALGAWVYVEIGNAIFTILALQKVLLYIIGGASMVLWLFIAIIWSTRPLQEERLKPFGALFLLHTVIIICGIVAAFYVQSFFNLVTPGINWEILFRSGLLVLCFSGMFLVSGLLIFIIRKTKGLLNVEVLSIGVIGIWLSANILRATFHEFTIAWWTASFLILSGLVLGPVALGLTAFVMIGRAETLQQRSELYSDILIHDLKNYHQVIRSSLELLTLPNIRRKGKIEAIGLATSGLEKAIRLINQVQSLTRASELEPGKFEKVDLVVTIQEAWSHIRSASPSLECEFRFDAEPDTFFVRANRLLVDVFLNLFNNAIDYSPRDRIHITVTINSKQEQKQDWWEIRVIDQGQGITDEQKQLLFQRYTESAHGMGLGLSVVQALTKAFSGTIAVEDRVPGDHTKGTVFVVSLPVLQE